MSATNRGGKRNPSDNYETPYWITHRILEAIDLPKSGVWYEPCAGEGAIIHAVEMRIPGLEWWANELRAVAIAPLSRVVSRARITCGDYLRLESFPKDVSVVITNPPFRIADKVIHKTLAAFPHAHVIVLLRLDFIAPASKGGRRHALMTTYAPDVYVLPNRPSFRDYYGVRDATMGTTDAADYAWNHWKPVPRARRSGKIEVLPLTPLAERKREPVLSTLRGTRGPLATLDGEREQSRSGSILSFPAPG